MNVFCLLLRCLLAGVFLYSGIVKAGASEQFALALVPFSFVPTSWMGPLSLAIPLTEIAAGILILLPSVHRMGSFLVALLCLVFIGVLVWALSNDLVVACSCFGEDSSPPSREKMLAAIVRDALLLAAVLCTLLANRPQTSRESLKSHP